MREGLSFCTKCGKAAPSPIQPNTVRNVEINQSPDSDELSTAVNSTCRELANLAALGFKKWKTLNTKGKIAAVITALVIWSMLRRMFFLF